jgi:hypothetical protein
VKLVLGTQAWLGELTGEISGRGIERGGRAGCVVVLILRLLGCDGGEGEAGEGWAGGAFCEVEWEMLEKYDAKASALEESVQSGRLVVGSSRERRGGAIRRGDGRILA